MENEKEEYLIKLLEILKERLDSKGIVFWLDWGTLLGAIREQRFIPGDHDVDLCAWKKDVKQIKEVFNDLPYYFYFERDEFVRVYHKQYNIGIHFVELKNGSFDFNYTFPIGTPGKLFDYLHWIANLRDPNYKESTVPIKISKTLMNIFKLFPRKNIISIIETLMKKINSYNITLSIPEHYFNSFKNIELYGMKLKVPKEAEGYLAYKYGPNWRTPQKYVYWEDDGSIVKKERY